MAVTVVRDEFATSDPELAEDLIRRAYIGQRLSISGRPEDFTFAHRSTTATGPCSFAVNRMRNTLTVHNEAGSMADLLVADVVRRGALRVSDSADFDGVVSGPGEGFLAPPTGPVVTELRDVDVDVVPFSLREVADHAAARVGLAPDALRFTGLAPVTPRADRLWVDTVTHVRDHVLAAPQIASVPVLLHGAFQTLVTAMLVTFPNTALDALTDPDAPAPGRVDEPALREVVDLLHARAGEPLGPTDVAAAAGAPARDVDHALRRRRNTSLAEEFWRARMQGVYRDLDAGTAAAGDTVVAIALRWGFTNPATFAVAYTLASGGESPEDTLRR